jgi:hypothetical protein
LADFQTRGKFVLCQMLLDPFGLQAAAQYETGFDQPHIGFVQIKEAPDRTLNPSILQLLYGLLTSHMLSLSRHLSTASCGIFRLFLANTSRTTMASRSILCTKRRILSSSGTRN